MELPAGFVLDAPAPPPPRRSRLQGDAEFIGANIAGAADSLSMGFGDEISAGLGAIAPALLTDKSLADAYSENLARNRARNKEIKERNPVGYTTGQVGGFLAGGGASALTKGGKALANSLRSGNILGYELGLAGRAAKAGALGAATSGVAGFGAGEGLENRVESSGDSALAGGVLGAAIPVAGAAVSKVAKGVADEVKSLRPATAKTTKELRDAAGPLYKQFTQSGGVYSDKLTNEIADLADSFKLNGIAGATKKSDEALNEALDFYAGLRGKKLSPEDLQKLDQSLADDIGRFNRAGEYNFGRILNNLKYEMRDRAFNPATAVNYVDTASPSAVDALKEANKLYSQSYKTADIEKILAKAKGTENPQTSIRTNLKNLLANEKKMANYSKEEKAVLEDALKRGYTGGLLKLFGGRLTDSLAGGAAGFTAGGPVGAIVGTVAGKAVGGVAADVAGGIQANRLRGALSDIQTGNTTVSKGGLPAISAPNPLAVTVPISAIAAGQSPKPSLQSPETPAGLPPGFIIDQAPQQAPAPMSDASPLAQKIKTAESGGNPNAKNPNSSASGLYQFTDSTWRSAVDKWGRRHGIRYSDKNNPQAQEMLMQQLTQDNARILQNKGIEPSDGNLYFAHFLGAPAASKAINLLGKNAIAARSFPEAAKANPTIFFAEGKPRTVDEVYALITQKVRA